MPTAEGLLHPRKGYSAEYVRRRVGASTPYRVRRLEDEVRTLNRIVVLRMRGFRGIRLETNDKEIVPGAEGWLGLVTDEYAQLKPVNGRPDVGKLTIDAAAICATCGGGGCDAAIPSVTDCSNVTQTATVCGATIKFNNPQYVAAKHSGTANAQVLDLSVCFPDALQPDHGLGGWSIRPPDGWMSLPSGSACAGGCADVTVPFWTDLPQ